MDEFNENVTNLLETAENITEKPEKNLRSSAVKDNLRKALDTVKQSIDSLTKNNSKELLSLPPVVNCIAKILTGVIEKVTEHGNQIKNMLENIKSEESKRESMMEELQRKYEELQAQSKHEKDRMEKVMEERKDKLEKEFDRKVEDLDKKVDEARQREMKGTLIVSSPDRENFPTLAGLQNRQSEELGSTGKETVMDMVLRMVYEKTLVRIPKEDVSACHKIGKKENYSYVLRVWNRKPYSAWDLLTTGMRTGWNVEEDQRFSNANVFINFMLTTRRTQISKQVRNAKKGKLIDRYSIDQNGRIFVKKLGDNSFNEVFSVDDVENYVKKT